MQSSILLNGFDSFIIIIINVNLNKRSFNGREITHDDGDEAIDQ